MFDAQTARHQMVEQQVRAWSVLDLKVLDVMDRIPREQFVPPAFREVAYADMNVPLGHGQSMLAPKVEGRILQALAIQRQDRALEVGTGSGYFAACLAQLASSVRSIEIVQELADTARANLERNGVRSVTVEVADAMRLSEESAFDVIAVTGSLPVYDPRFERALAVGGRLFVTVGAGPVMDARRITRVGRGDWTRETLFETRIDPLVNAPGPPAFVF
jgi:protein-L-isoaspartate(D-aspartate) O-methyltransferase